MFRSEAAKARSSLVASQSTERRQRVELATRAAAETELRDALAGARLEVLGMEEKLVAHQPDMVFLVRRVYRF